METTATILHADLDAFYASVEQLLDPSLRGKPIAVGGGVVLAASYEAKAFGIRGGMSGRRARELCPQLIFVGGHFKDYQRLGEAAINVLNDFTPLVERISIDEAFADVAGCTHLFGPPAEIANTVRRRVRAELGLPISIGVARTKHLAKIASQVAKPDGLVLVDPDTELDFLHDLPNLADRVATRLRAKSRPGRTVTVRVRFADLHSVTRSVTLDAPISATGILAEIAEELVRTALADHPDERTISLLAISVSQLEKHWDVQLELPLGLEDEERRPGTKRGMARWIADCAVDIVRDRFGWEAVGYGSVALGLSRSVPDEFRELAEKDL
jgi:nucleotidyltransferase/DNA polymerase involved in DNA repair